MDLTEKIDYILNDIDRLDEAGIRNIRELTKDHKEAEIYYHKDTDGVTSCIAIKEYLKQYGVKVVALHPINYGAEEYAVAKPKDKTLHVMVDFAHGKPMMNIHTDHHDKQSGIDPKNVSTSFVHSPSNAAYLSQILPPNDIFPTDDVKIISMVDSADFARNGISPEDVMRAAFNMNPEIDVEKNKVFMGLVVNKLLLAYKNKKEFLNKLIMASKPSLINMYINIKKIAKEEGYAPAEEIIKHQKNYIEAQSKSSKVKLVGKTIMQYGGGSMIKTGAYDRYTPFKIYPSAHYFCIAWPMGLVQLSKNPFIKGTNPHHLGDLVIKTVLPKFKSKLSKLVTLLDVKRIFETNIKEVKDQMGFTVNDVLGLFEDKIKISDKQMPVLKKIMDKKFIELSNSDKNFLKSFKISAWDLVIANSGGHKDITNISGLNFYGKGYVDLMKDIQQAIVDEMSDKSLE